MCKWEDHGNIILKMTGYMIYLINNLIWARCNMLGKPEKTVIYY
jgi:hypothetical protein